MMAIIQDRARATDFWHDQHNRSMKTTVFALIIPLMLLTQHGSAQYHKSYIGLTTSFGGGFNSFDTGLRTETNEVIEVSSGGGTSIGITGAYAFSGNWLAGGELNYQFTMMSPPVDNADGGFKHMNILASIQRLFPVGKRENAFLLSAGPVLSTSNMFDFDASQVPGGAHNTYHYKPAGGGQISTEFILQKGDGGFAFVFGLRTNFIRYKLDRVNSNGVEFDAEGILLDFLQTDVTKPNGAGMDLTIRGIYRFAEKHQATGNNKRRYKR